MERYSGQNLIYLKLIDRVSNDGIDTTRCNIIQQVVTHFDELQCDSLQTKVDIYALCNSREGLA